jgi:type IV secretory pathway TrbL component
MLRCTASLDAGFVLGAADGEGAEMYVGPETLVGARTASARSISARSTAAATTATQSGIKTAFLVLAMDSI